MEQKYKLNRGMGNGKINNTEHQNAPYSSAPDHR